MVDYYKHAWQVIQNNYKKHGTGLGPGFVAYVEHTGKGSMKKQCKKSLGERLSELEGVQAEQYCRLLDAIQAQKEPAVSEPKLILDKLKQATEEALKLKLTIEDSHISADVDQSGVLIHEFGNRIVRLNMHEVLKVRDWMTTLLGEDKVVYRDRTVVPFNPVPTDSGFIPGTYVGAAFLGAIWALVHFIL